MPRYGERPGYEERVEEGSDMAFGLLGGDYVDPDTMSFKPGHEDRVKVVRETLGPRGIGIPPEEIEDAIAVAEACALDHARHLQHVETLRSLGLGGN